MKGRLFPMFLTRVPRTFRSSFLAAAALLLGGVMPQAATQHVAAQTAVVDDYAAEYLGGPWDMSDPTRFGFDYTRKFGNVANLTLANGVLSATATNNDPRVTLLMPSPPAANPTLPEGGVVPVNTSLYRYLTVRVNVSKQSYAQVFWQTNQGSTPSGSAFQQVNPGWQTLVFDLAAGGTGSSGSWSDTVQGLYFDPTMVTTSDFQIDYVRLSSARLANPDDMPPALQITAPSYTSGPDYAATELGNPWDMSDAADVTSTNAIGNISFTDGVLNASTGNCSGAACGDPQVGLHVGAPINTSKYKYMTYRMKIDSLPNVFPESVARLLWWSDIPNNASVTRDIVVYEGWRVVSYDMTKVRLENEKNVPSWTSSRPIFFRLDPHEETTARTFHIDYVKLTGDDQANSSFDIRYSATDDEGQNLTTQFYYDTDNSGFNGQAITCGAAQTNIPRGRFQLFLPSLSKPGAASTVDGASCRWDTSAVAAGTYYVYGVTNDGTNTTRVYSQTPVVVTH